MALPGFSAAHHKPIPLGSCLAVAEAEAAAPGPEGQQAGHRVGLAGGIDQLLAEQQEAAAFAVDRQALSRSPAQVRQAALAARQLGTMQFRIAARQHQGPAVRRQGGIGQGRPGPHLESLGLQQFGGFGVAEVKGLVAGDRNRQGLAGRNLLPRRFA